MSDASFRELLGVQPDATREEIRRCWRRRLMQNHPDRFPPERKSLQELRVIALNEAYASLMALARHPKASGSAAAADAGPRMAAPAPGSGATAVGPHRDPAYAYYKQGFL
jgi:hypothetical protein